MRPLAPASSTLSILFFSTFLATATGAASISLTLKLADSFSPFMFVVSGAVLVGSVIFLACRSRASSRRSVSTLDKQRFFPEKSRHRPG